MAQQTVGEADGTQARSRSHLTLMAAEVSHQSCALSNREESYSKVFAGRGAVRRGCVLQVMRSYGRMRRVSQRSGDERAHFNGD